MYWFNIQFSIIIVYTHTHTHTHTHIYIYIYIYIYNFYESNFRNPSKMRWGWITLPSVYPPLHENPSIQDFSVCIKIYHNSIKNIFFLPGLWICWEVSQLNISSFVCISNPFQVASVIASSSLFSIVVVKLIIYFLNFFFRN